MTIQKSIDMLGARQVNEEAKRVSFMKGNPSLLIEAPETTVLDEPPDLINSLLTYF